MNILYLHGFASYFNPDTEKVKTLQEAFDCKVLGKDIDYTKPPTEIIKEFHDSILQNDIDLIVGTSMGGWLSAELGQRWGIPFIAINPAINPQETLKKYIGTREDYQGKQYTLTEETVNEFYPMIPNGCGLILLDMGDEVINAHQTLNTYKEFYVINTFLGGNHRFVHMKEAIPHIRKFYEQSIWVYT